MALWEEEDMMNLTYFDYSNEFTRSSPKISLEFTVFMAVFGVLAMVSVICNSLVLAVVLKRPQLHNFPYITISFLAILDLINSLLTLNILIFELPQLFTLPPIFCKVCIYLQHVTSMAFAVCMCVLALVRWKGKKRLQFGEKKDVWKSVLLMLLVLLVAAAVSYPFYHYTISFQIVEDNRSVCYSDIPFFRHGFIPSYDLILVAIKCGIFSLLVIVSLLLAKRRRAWEVVDVDAEGEVVDTKRRLDVRFESMLLILWGVYVAVEVLERCIPLFSMAFSYYGVAIKAALLAVLYFLFIYKLFLYRSMDKNFRMQLNAMLQWRSHE